MIDDTSGCASAMPSIACGLVSSAITKPTRLVVQRTDRGGVGCWAAVQLDLTNEEVQLEGLEEELALWGDHEVVRAILSKVGTPIPLCSAADRPPAAATPLRALPPSQGADGGSWLGQGTDVREHVREVDTRLRQVELESIEDYIAESDNLVALHQHIQTCDGILQTMETLLGGFQADLGSISTEVAPQPPHRSTPPVAL